MANRTVVAQKESEIENTRDKETEIPIIPYRTYTPDKDGEKEDIHQVIPSAGIDEEKERESPQFKENTDCSSDEINGRENRPHEEKNNTCHKMSRKENSPQENLENTGSCHEDTANNNDELGKMENGCHEDTTNNSDELSKIENKSKETDTMSGDDTLIKEVTPNGTPMARNNSETELAIIDEFSLLDPDQRLQSKVTFSASTKGINIEDGTKKPLKCKQSKLEKFVVDKICCNHPGIFLAFSFGLISSFTSVQIKELHGYSPFLLSFYRNIIRLVLTLPFMIYFKYNPFPKTCMYRLIFRSVLAALTGIFRIYAFQKLPIADATVIMYVYPVMVIVLASIFLKEKFGLFHIFTCLISFVGVALICQPKFLFGNEFLQLDLIGVAFALASAIVGSFAFIFTKQLGKNVSYTVMAFDQVLMGSLITIIFVLSFNKFQWPQTLQDLGLIMGMSIFSHLYHFINYKALQLENAGLVGIVRTIEVPLVYIWQVAFYSKIPVGLQILGIIMVMLTTLMILLYKWSVSWKEDSLGKRVLKKLSMRNKNT